MNDDELRSALARWRAPEPGSDAAERTWAAFGRRHKPAWRRVIGWRMNVPVPVAALAGMMILALGVWAGVALRPRSVPQIIVQTRTIPVVVEKVVIRKVVIRERPPAHRAKPQPLTLAGFRPVREIELEVIRRN